MRTNIALSVKTSLYAGYTQGIEDSGAAPGEALNRGQILPSWWVLNH